MKDRRVTRTVRVLLAALLVMAAVVGNSVYLARNEHPRFVVAGRLPPGHAPPVIGEPTGPPPAQQRRSREVLFRNPRSQELLQLVAERTATARNEWDAFEQSQPPIMGIVGTRGGDLKIAIKSIDQPSPRGLAAHYDGRAFRPPNLAITLRAEAHSYQTVERIVQRVMISANGELIVRERLPKGWIKERVRPGEGGFQVDLRRTVVYPPNESATSPIWITTLQRRPPEIGGWPSERLKSNQVWWDPDAERSPVCRAVVLVTSRWALVRGCTGERAETRRTLASLYVADATEIQGVTRQPIYSVADFEVAGSIVAEGDLGGGQRWREMQRSPLFHDLLFGKRVVGLIGVPGTYVVSGLGDVDEVGWVRPSINATVIGVRTTRQPRQVRVRLAGRVVTAQFTDTDLEFQYAFLPGTELTRKEAQTLVVETSNGTIMRSLHWLAND